MKLRIFETTTFYRVVNNKALVIDVPPGVYSIKPVENAHQVLFLFTNLEEIGPKLKGKVFATKRHLESQGMNILIIP